MSNVLEIDATLTAEESERVRTFIESMVASRPAEPAAPPADPPPPMNDVRFDGWAGCLAHVDPEKSDKQLIREAWDEMIDKWDRRDAERGDG